MDRMAQPVNPPRGMRDFLPADKARREHALGVIRSSYAAQGFDEIETPVMEDAARLHSGLGGDNEKLAFGILRRGLTGEAVAELATAGDLEALTDLGLRFDLTVPLARFYASHRAALPSVFKSIQIAPVWRAERPQKGRYRQFVQCDIDIIGEQGVIAEIELITATIATLDALGLTGCTIRINHRAILRGLIASWGVPETGFERAMITIDKEDKIGVDGVVAELLELGLVPESASAAVAESLSGLPDDGQLKALLVTGVSSKQAGKKVKIATMVNLLSPDGADGPAIEHEKAFCEAHGVTFINIALPMAAPPKAMTQTWFDAVRAARAAHTAVYVHC